MSSNGLRQTSQMFRNTLAATLRQNGNNGNRGLTPFSPARTTTATTDFNRLAASQQVRHHYRALSGRSQNSTGSATQAGDPSDSFLNSSRANSTLSRSRANSTLARSRANSTLPIPPSPHSSQPSVLNNSFLSFRPGLPEEDLLQTPLTQQCSSVDSSVLSTLSSGTHGAETDELLGTDSLGLSMTQELQELLGIQNNPSLSFESPSLEQRERAEGNQLHGWETPLNPFSNANSPAGSHQSPGAVLHGDTSPNQAAQINPHSPHSSYPGSVLDNENAVIGLGIH